MQISQRHPPNLRKDGSNGLFNFEPLFHHPIIKNPPNGEFSVNPIPNISKYHSWLITHKINISKEDG
jgi:hypothetical protein